MHAFPKDAAGKAFRYGIYGMARNEEWVNVGRDRHTPAFSVASLRRWRNEMGKRRYAEVWKLSITVDTGCSNGYRAHAWKHGLQKFADETHPSIQVSYFPPSTSEVQQD